MHIFAAEKDISGNIKSNTSIAYNMPIGKAFEFTDSKGNSLDKSIIEKYFPITLQDHIEDKYLKQIIEASLKDDQLYYHTAILVTSNWNKNDDVFRPDIIYSAKDTPVDKPTNLGHDSTKIIGHMTNSWPIDEAGKVINITNASELPNKFHILVGSVIYKVWPSSEEYEKTISDLITKIEAGEKYVSMECTFKNFDYALSNDDGIKFIERNKNTAFLSKYLRAYGGEGVFKDYKIGRAVSEISFCGKGYVDKPANPESIIFTKNDIADFSKAEILNNFDEKTTDYEKSGVISSDNENLNKVERIMTDFYKEQNDELKTQNVSLAKSLDDLKEKLAQSNVSKLEDEIKTLRAQTNDMSDVLKQKSADITAKASELVEVAKKLDDSIKANDGLTKTNKELTDRIQAVETEKKIVARVSTLVSGGFSKEEADAKVKIFASLDDTQFDAVAKEIIEAKKKVKPKVDDAEDLKDGGKDESTEGKENPGNVKAEDLENAEKPKDDVASAGVADGEFDITELAGKLSAELKTKTKDGDK